MVLTSLVFLEKVLETESNLKICKRSYLLVSRLECRMIRKQRAGDSSIKSAFNSSTLEVKLLGLRQCLPIFMIMFELQITYQQFGAVRLFPK